MKILAQVDNYIITVDSQTDFRTVHKIEKGDNVELDLSHGLQGDTWPLKHAKKSIRRSIYQMLSDHFSDLAEEMKRDLAEEMENKNN